MADANDADSCRDTKKVFDRVILTILMARISSPFIVGATSMRLMALVILSLDCGWSIVSWPMVTFVLMAASFLSHLSRCRNPFQLMLMMLTNVSGAGRAEKGRLADANDAQSCRGEEECSTG